jgi:hypothetical protein
MTAPKSNPNQRGRKTEAKVPMFAVVSPDQPRAAGGKLWRFLKYWGDADAGIKPALLTDAETIALNEAALRQALQLALEDLERRDQIAEKLESEEWGDAAVFAAYGQQINSLGLKPWQTPPSMLACDAEEFDAILARPDPIGDYATVKLTRMMIKLGVSVYAPDPIAEIKTVLKHARRGRPPR